jgi:hypothetical protein
LNGGKSPRRMLSAELDVIGQQVKLSERVKHSREDLPLPQFKPPINITVGPEEEYASSSALVHSMNRIP